MAYPEIYNSSGQRLAILDNITSNEYVRRINDLYEFNFTCEEAEFKTEYLTFDNEVRIGSERFDIKYIDVSHGTGIIYDVKCEHVFYRLSDTQVDSYANTGTPSAILADILSGTDFSVGTVDFTAPVVFAVNRNASLMNIVRSLANSLGAEIGFDGFDINLLDSIGQDNGYQIRLKKNLKGISKSVDRRGEDRTSYRIDVVDVSSSEEYADLALVETVDIGDTVRVIDETLGIDITQAVFEIRRDVIKESNVEVVLENNFQTLADKVSFIEQQAIKQSDIIYGVRVNNDVGLEIERTDQLARTVLNADEFRMQTGDGGGSYTDALYFDPIGGKYVFVGEVSITGGSGIDNLTDAGDLASLNEVDTTTIADGAITTAKIFAGAVVADKIDVSTLSAISADLGTITAGTINAVTINGATVNSANINIDDDVVIGNALIMGVVGSSGSRLIDFRNESGSTAGFIQADPVTDGLEVISGNGGLDLEAPTNVTVRAYGSSGTIAIRANDDVELLAETGQVTIGGDFVLLNPTNQTDILGDAFYNGSEIATLSDIPSVPSSTGNDVNTAAHNHGIPDGTVLQVAGGGTVTYSVYGGDTHDHSI